MTTPRYLVAINNDDRKKPLKRVDVVRIYLSNIRRANGFYLEKSLIKEHWAVGFYHH